MAVLDSRQRNWLDDLQFVDEGLELRRCADRLPARAGRMMPARSAPARPRSARPGPARPDLGSLSYRGNGIGVSRVPHAPRRPVGWSATVAAACLSALITLWLGWIAHFSAGPSAETVTVPDRLAVVHVQAGETLQQLAGRMVPGAPVAQVVERIRDLNNLDSAEIGARQTLIAPVG